MDTAFEMMCTFRQTRDLNCAALKNPGFGHRDPRKTASTLGHRCFSVAERWYEAPAELRYLSESVGLAALVNYADNCSFPDLECVRCEVPIRVWSSSLGFCKQVGESCGISGGDILAVVRPLRGVKSGWIALVQGNNLCDTR